MRVLHVSPYSGDAWAYGGIPRVVEALTDGLASRGHHVTVCTTDASNRRSRLPGPGRRWSSWRQKRPSGVEVHVFPNASNALAYHQQLFLPLGLRRFLEAEARSFDVAHLHACRNFPGAVAAEVLERAGVPYVLAPNGTAPIIERRRLAKRVFDRFWGHRVLQGASRVLAVTDAERHQLRQLGVPDGSIRQLPNPVDAPVQCQDPGGGSFRQQHDVGSRPLVLFLGKLTPRKRVDVLIRAFGHLPQDAARLIIAGNDMGSLASLQALTRACQLEKRVTFVGLLSGERRLQALAEADVVVYPSEHEIFGLVPCEALSMGTPVIVSNDSGCGEILGPLPGVQTVTVGNADVLSKAIATVLANPSLWRARASSAGPMVQRRFGADAVCSTLERIYAELV